MTIIAALGLESIKTVFSAGIKWRVGAKNSVARDKKKFSSRVKIASSFGARSQPNFQKKFSSDWMGERIRDDSAESSSASGAKRACTGEKRESSSRVSVLAARNGVRRTIAMLKTEHARRMREYKRQHKVDDGKECDQCDGVHSAYLDSLSFHVCVTKRRQSAFVKPCRLWRANIFMLFPTDRIWLNELAVTGDEQRRAAHAVIADIKRKASEPWTRRMPLHECVDARVYVDPINGFKEGSWTRTCVCNESGGMSHCAAFEHILSANFGRGLGRTSVFGSEFEPTVSIESDNVVFPIHLQGNNMDAAIEGSQVTQESVHVRVVSGLYEMPNFAGIGGLHATLRYVVLKDCYFCPHSSESTPLHDCTVHGCAVHDPYSGFATCTMTAVTLNMSEAMRAQDEYAKVNQANTWSQERDEIMRLKRSVIRSDNDLARGVTRDDIASDRELRQDLEHYAERNNGAFGVHNSAGSQSRASLNEVRRRKSNKMTRRERRKKEGIMKVIGRISERGESSSALKILNTGHLSSTTDYMDEAIFRLQTAIGTGLRARSSMARYLTRVVDSGRSAVSKTSTGGTGRRIKKYVVPEQEEDMRRQAEEAKRTRGVDIEIVVLRNEKRLVNMMNDHIKKVAHHALVFWIILRVRTEDGANNPNLIPFSAFVLAFAYMMRDGYSFRSSSDGSEEVLLPENRFLKYMLPDRSLLDKIDQILSEKDTYNCVRNVKRILTRHCVTDENSCADISPFAAHNAEMDIEEVQKRRPDLFEGLRRRRRTNR